MTKKSNFSKKYQSLVDSGKITENDLTLLSFAYEYHKDLFEEWDISPGEIQLINSIQKLGNNSQSTITIDILKVIYESQTRKKLAISNDKHSRNMFILSLIVGVATIVQIFIQVILPLFSNK